MPRYTHGALFYAKVEIACSNVSRAALRRLPRYFFAQQLRQLGDIHRDPPWLGQRQIAPELLQVSGDESPSKGLRALRRVEPDFERDRDSHQHATQHNDLAYRHCS